MEGKHRPGVLPKMRRERGAFDGKPAPQFPFRVRAEACLRRCSAHPPRYRHRLHCAVAPSFALQVRISRMPPLRRRFVLRLLGRARRSGGRSACRLPRMEVDGALAGFAGWWSLRWTCGLLLPSALAARASVRKAWGPAGAGRRRAFQALPGMRKARAARWGFRA